MSCAGVLLTGGASRRFGSDKATYVLGGETLAARGARVLAAVCAPVIEVGPGHTTLPSVREHPPGAGPLAAFLAGVDALATAQPFLVLACDLPHVSETALRVLAEWPGDRSVVPVAAGRPQYACARWSQRAIEAGRAAFAAGERALGILATVDADVVPNAVPVPLLADVDTPEDLRRLGLS